jgi:hypothetical protein
MKLDIDGPSEHIDVAVVKRLIDLFYCSPKGEKMVEDNTPQIHKQVCMATSGHGDYKSALSKSR